MKYLFTFAFFACAFMGCESGEGEGGGGLSCTVVDNEDGTYTMSCPDGTSVTWSDGEGGDGDEDGAQLCFTENDSDADGTVDGRGTNTYDANGNRIALEVADADGIVISRHTWTYDTNGNPLTWEVDNDADGTADMRTTSFWGNPTCE